jgi:hypothetical protein
MTSSGLLSFAACAVMSAAPQQLKADSAAAVLQTLPAMARAWLSAERNRDAKAFERTVADELDRRHA